MISIFSVCLMVTVSNNQESCYVSLATNQMQYTVIFQLTKVFIYNVFFYGRPVIYVALMKCKTNYILFENSTFTGIQHNRLKSFDEYGIMPSIIFVHISLWSNFKLYVLFKFAIIKCVINWHWFISNQKGTCWIA